MKKILISVFVGMAVALNVSAQRVGLVLSGGGAKGIAHVGVIQALEENNIPIDCVTGTSMGAIVGGLYAMGYSPSQMMEILTDKEFLNWSTGTDDSRSTWYSNRTIFSPRVASLRFGLGSGKGDAMSFLPSSLINPLPMNFAFMELFSQYTAQCDGDFDKLYVPFRCVGSDVYDKKKVVFSRGSLGDAIRISMTFPLAFKPLKRGGKNMFDGGIYDNFPVDVMEEDFHPDFIIGVSVSAGKKPSDSQDITDQIDALVFQPQPDSVRASMGVKISVDVKKYNLLDFPKARAIYEAGYARGLEFVDSIRARIGSREVTQQQRVAMREKFASATPKFVFSGVTATGGTPDQQKYVCEIFENKHNETFNIDQARSSFYRTIAPGKFSDLIPSAKYNKADSTFTLNLEMTENKKLSAGVGGWLTSSTNSMLYFDAGYHTLSLNSFSAMIQAWIGQSYYAAELNGKFNLATSVPQSIGLQAVFSKTRQYQREVMFYEDETPQFLLNYEYYARLKYRVATSRLMALEFGLGYGFLRNEYFPSYAVEVGEKDIAHYRLGQFYARAESNTLDAVNFPVHGRKYAVTAMGILGASRVDYLRSVGDSFKSLKWASLAFDAEGYVPVSNKFTLGIKGETYLSSIPLRTFYDEAITQASAFAPTVSTQNYFNAGLRSNMYASIGLIPVFKPVSGAQVRGEFHCYQPLRSIIANPADGTACYDKWFRGTQFVGELDLVYSMRFATICGYVNYTSTPAKNWNFGISLGVFLPSQKFLKF